MALPRDYAGQQCSLARALEVVGERWTLLIVRDAFFGVRRFGDFARHLNIPRAVLTERLGSLTESGVLAGVSGSHGHTEYALTDKGIALWPVVRSLLTWGDQHYSETGGSRVFQHAADDGAVAGDGTCVVCGAIVPVREIVVSPGPALAARPDPDPVTVALARPHLLLEPIRAAAG